MKRELISKRLHISVEQIATAIASAPDQVDDPDCAYDPNDAASVKTYWANASAILPGQHRFQQNRQSGQAMTEKTIAEKMYVHKAGSIAVLNREAGSSSLLAALPADKLAAADEAAELVLLFATSQQELATLLPQAKARMAPKAALWVAYRKGGAKRNIGLHRDTIREHAATIGLDSVAIVAIDDDWSALRLKQV
ncbi:DUF3052 family protein [Rugamonas apoptosis]|uniref:DUF3052 family protein n=1 Tax=Rugamonas apoptosis TaxID=2758570 RepID=A0A7W2FAD7_9BURK|nr:DUF3052 family protein [Rugamonas apoptosis]MBA5688046.1 DUF3052 family protein [Rugamonas apoptosis]